MLKKILPVFFLWIIVLSTFLSVVRPVSAQSAVVPTPDVGYSPDAEVNFVGKAAARSIYFLNWTLQNYQWQCYRPPASSGTPAPEDPQKPCQNEDSPLIGFWQSIRNIVYAFFAIFVLVTAFVLMTTRGRSLTFQRFLPRFVAVVLLVTFSYALLQFIYITGDIIQGFFLTKAVPPGAPAGTRPQLISAEDLLYVGWDYENFSGLRKIHPFYDESVFVNLLLARMTAVTYYAITGILLIRKIILWFFIVLSPVFPVLLLYYPVRNTAKIWIGEFFRWLMYAPLFSIFLSGLVSLWKTGIPLLFRFEDAINGRIIYPTATNILLGGPGQIVTDKNNLNLPDTFAQYVVALIMLWVVLLLPFVLLQIFLDYLNSFSFNDSPAFQKLLTSSYSLLNRPPPGPTPLNPSGGPPPGTTGIARSLPIAKYSDAKQIPNIQDTGDAKALPIAMPSGATMQAQINSQMLAATSLSLPTIRDIANYETSMISQSGSTTVSSTYQSLQKIANPQSITNPIERDKFTQLREQLVQQSQTGNSVASSVLSAVNIVNNVSTITNNKSVQSTKNLKNALTQIANPATATSTDRERITQIHDSLVKESQQGNTLASTILSTTKETSNIQLQNIKDQLVKESANNNNVATNVLATTMSSVETSTLQQVVKDIANPQNVTNQTERETLTKIHDSLVKESEKGNDVATTILNTKEVSISQVQELKEKLLDASLKGDQTATSILSTAIVKSDSQTTQQFLQQLANPSTVTNTVEKEKLTQLKEKITQAQQQGSPLASEVLSTVTALSQTDTTKPEATNSQQVQNLKQKLLDAKEKGEPLAAEMLQMMNGSADINASLPQSNRVQAVSSEDYEAVKKMWQENYKNLEMPEGVTNRKEWIANDISNVDDIVSLLTSDDQQKVQQGMQEVSNILPFLLLGGFSKDEIVGYLKAKQEAGKSVLEVIAQEDEDTLVNVQTRHATTSGTMAQHASISYSSSDSHDDDDVDSPIQNIMSRPVQINSELLQLTNLPVPTIKDVVRFEMTLLSKDAKNTEDVTRVKETLQQIANPSSITSTTDRERVEQIREKIIQNSQQGDVLATSILNAANHLTQSSTTQSVTNMDTVLQQIVNPTTVTSEQDRPQFVAVHDQIAAAAQQGNQTAAMLVNAINTLSQKEVTTFRETVEKIAHPETITVEQEKQQFAQLHDTLVTQQQQGNQLAGLILTVTPETPLTDIQSMQQQVNQAKDQGDPAATELSKFVPKTVAREEMQQLHQALVHAKETGDPLAAAVLGLVKEDGQTGLPDTNRIQQVSLEDYEAVRAMWQENYKNVEVPAGLTDRKEWIAKDVENIDQIISLLTSTDQQQVQQGMQQVSNILPFLLLGGFSKDEIVGYLTAKREAGKSVVQALSQENSEDTMITVERHTTATPAVMTQTVEETDDSSVDSVNTPAVQAPAVDGAPKVVASPVKVNTQLLQLTSLAVPTIKDIVLFEKALQSADQTKIQEVTRVQEILKAIATPDVLQNDQERARAAEMKETLQVESEKGDPLAKTILNAANQASHREQQDDMAGFHVFLQHLIASQPDAAAPNPENESAGLYNELAKQRDAGNQLATLLLSVTADTPEAQIQQIYAQLLAEKNSGNQIAALLLEKFLGEKKKEETVALPDANQVQTVSVSDYEAVRQLWEEHFEKEELPAGETDRIAWIKREIERLQTILSLLTSDEEGKRTEGMQYVSNLLPFLLLGGFTLTEIITYLKAKLQAGLSVLQRLTQTEQETVVEAPAPQSDQAPLQMAVATIDPSPEQPSGQQPTS